MCGLPICPSTYLFKHRSVYPFIYLSTYISTYLSTYSFIYPSIYLPIYVTLHCLTGRRCQPWPHLTSPCHPSPYLTPLHLQVAPRLPQLYTSTLFHNSNTLCEHPRTDPTFANYTDNHTPLFASIPRTEHCSLRARRVAISNPALQEHPRV